MLYKYQRKIERNASNVDQILSSDEARRFLKGDLYSSSLQKYMDSGFSEAGFAEYVEFQRKIYESSLNDAYKGIIADNIDEIEKAIIESQNGTMFQDDARAQLCGKQVLAVQNELQKKHDQINEERNILIKRCDNCNKECMYCDDDKLEKDQFAAMNAINELKKQIPEMFFTSYDAAEFLEKLKKYIKQIARESMTFRSALPIIDEMEIDSKDDLERALVRLAKKIDFETFKKGEK